MKKEEKKATLFDFINQVCTKNRKYKYDKKIASAFMLTQWLSHDKYFAEKCNEINKYHNILPDEVIYEYYMNVLPSGKRYIKWIKKRKADEKLKKRIGKIQENFPNLSTKECKMIINQLVRRKK